MKKTMLSVAMLGALAAGSAMAENFYVSGDVGSARGNYSGLTKNSDTAVQVGVGYQYNKNLAVEADYTDLGRLADQVASVKTSAYSLSGVGSVGVTDTIGLYAKLGYGSASTKTSLGTKANRSDVVYGLGATYAVNSDVDIRASWTHISMGNGVSVMKGAENIYALGAVYKF